MKPPITLQDAMNSQVDPAWFDADARTKRRALVGVTLANLLSNFVWRRPAADDRTWGMSVETSRQQDVNLGSNSWTR